MRLPWDKDVVKLNKRGQKSITTNKYKNMEFYKKQYYPDNSFYVEVGNFNKTFIFRINSYEDLWELNQLHDVYKYNNKNAIVIIPNLFTSQEDRRFDLAQPFSLKLVLEFLKGMENFDYKIFHPHNSEVVEAILDNRVEIIDNHDFIYEVLAELKENYGFNTYDMEDRLILMSSDAGGFKPLMKLCDKLEWQGETYSASKSRKYENGKSILTQIVDRQDFNGKDILIIDDICVYGGTFKGLSKILKERNCGKLYLAVSHITIQDLGTDSVSEYFDKIFTTNSKFDSYFKTPVRYNNNIKNLSIINLF